MSTGKRATLSFSICAVLGLLIGTLKLTIVTSESISWIVGAVGFFLIFGAIFGPIAYVALKRASGPWLWSLLVIGLVLTAFGAWDLHRIQALPVIFAYGLVAYPASAVAAGAAVSLIVRSQSTQASPS